MICLSIARGIYSLHVSLNGARFLGTVYPHGIFVSSNGRIALAYPQKRNDDGDDDEDESQKLAGGYESERCGCRKKNICAKFFFLFFFFFFLFSFPKKRNEYLFLLVDLWFVCNIN
jgi:hypothetical protein